MASRKTAYNSESGKRFKSFMILNNQKIENVYTKPQYYIFFRRDRKKSETGWKIGRLNSNTSLS